MACSHLDALAQELIDAGIFTNAKQIQAGVWTGKIDVTRVYNYDETPQFIKYGVDGTPNGLVYVGYGDSCKRMMRENRECVTINPVVSLSGVICACQVIFATKGITNQMAPKEAVEKIDNLLISTTDNGCQDQMLQWHKINMFSFGSGKKDYRNVTEQHVGDQCAQWSLGFSSGIHRSPKRDNCNLIELFTP